MYLYELSVFQPFPCGSHIVHVFTVKCNEPMAWMRSHADETAAKALPGVAYDALMVKPLPVRA